MEKFNQMPTEEELIRQKISVIENIPTGVAPRGEVILVLLGEKPAVEMYIPNKDNALKAIEDLRSVGLFAELSEKDRKYHNPNSADILVAGSQEILDELKQTHSYEHHKRYGQLMGYPDTAVDAFIGENGEERLSKEEQDKLLDILPDILGGTFAFSKSHKDEELAIVKRRIKLLAQKAPELFYDLYKKEYADKILSYVLDYY
jgi:hypothetical protein